MSNSKKIILVDPACHTPEVECRDAIEAISPFPTHYVLPKLDGPETLDQIHSKEIAGIIIFGSAWSVNDHAPWQTGLSKWLKPLMDSGIATLGLCYGHQLVASLYGAPVDFMFEDHHKLSGMRQVQFKASPLTQHQTVLGELVVSHRESVTSCPPCMEIVGTSPDCPVDALCHKTLPIWTVQAHPEAVPAFLKNQSIPVPQNLGRLDFGQSLIKNFLALASTTA